MWGLVPSVGPRTAGARACCYTKGMVHRGCALLAVTLLLTVACPATRQADPAGANQPTDDDDDDDDVCAANTNKALLGASAVYFGTRAPSHVSLTPAQQRAVVGVGQGQAPGSVCSGTLISDTVVLTATHCTEGSAATSFYVTFGNDDYRPELVVDVVEKTEHPVFDIAMLRLARRPGDTIDVTPIAAFAGTLGSAAIGELFEQAGFGQTESGDSNGLFFVAEPFAGFEDGGYLQVNGEGRHGVCFGDSGGPSLRQTAEGDVRVMGALSYGDESCTGIDRYTRVDLVQDWIADFAGPIPAPGSATAGCGSITAAGRCNPDGTVAEFCDADVLVVVPCAATEVCGDDAAGKRCIPVADDPCGGVTAFGSCDGSVLSFCDAGIVRTRDCDACGGEVCGLVDNVVGHACFDDPCGGIDYLGQCDGNTARWCDAGVLKDLDCVAEGGTCGFVSDELGFYCQ